ncbi:extracellular solute-binding protein [Paenibacillus lautus]|uniref:extracellular solute-binding protein n=1 Tax=Paenibacillus lautus TaxID=1401 RepID=UPI002FBD5C81
MKGWMARMTAFSLTAALLLAGCSSGNEAQEGTPAADAGANFNETGLPVVNETISIRIPVVKQHYHKDYNEMVLVKELEEKTNIDVEWEQIPSESWTEKKNLILASGEFPDALFNGLTTQDVVDYGTEGVLIPLEDLIDKYAPNIKKILDENPQVRRMATAPDGHIYSVPWFEDQAHFQYRNTFLLNKTWLDQLGLSMPTTPDELIEVLKAFKERDPNGNGLADEIPSTFRHNTTTNGYYELFGAFGIADALTGFSVKDKKVEFEPVLTEYKTAIEFLNRMYEEGLLDKESFTQDAKQMLSKTKDEIPKVGLIASFNGTYELGDRVHEYVAMPPLMGPDGHQFWRRQDNRIILNFFSITKNNLHPEATMRFVDTMNDPKSAMQFKYGPFGTHLKEKPDGKVEIVPPQDGMDISTWIGSTTPSTAFPLLVSSDWLQKLEQSESDKLRNGFYEIYKPFIVPEDRTYPNLYMTAEENKRLGVLATDIMTYVRKMEAKWIVEGGIETEWDKYVEDLNRMGLEEMIQIKQQAYDRYIGS